MQAATAGGGSPGLHGKLLLGGRPGTPALARRLGLVSRQGQSPLVLPLFAIRIVTQWAEIVGRSPEARGGAPAELEPDSEGGSPGYR